jgi:phosphopantetheine--protein transferase-like protein
MPKPSLVLLLPMASEMAVLLALELIKVCLISFFTDRSYHLRYFLELISSVPSHNSTFVSRNFTEAEITYCRSQPSPPSSFAARWVGKEAVFKSLGVKSKGAAAAMKDIEIINDESGVPTVHLHGEAKAGASAKGISKVLISLSHSEVRWFCIFLVNDADCLCIDCCHCICPSIVIYIPLFALFVIIFSHQSFTIDLLYRIQVVYFIALDNITFSLFKNQRV